MSRVCSITGSKAMRGSVIHRRGLAKKKGGVGRHVTKNVPRIFAPNLRHQRIWVPELKEVCAHSRYRPRSEDNQQTRRLQGASKSRRHLTRS